MPGPALVRAGSQMYLSMDIPGDIPEFHNAWGRTVSYPTRRTTCPPTYTVLVRETTPNCQAAFSRSRYSFLGNDERRPGIHSEQDPKLTVHQNGAERIVHSQVGIPWSDVFGTLHFILATETVNGKDGSSAETVTSAKPSKPTAANTTLLMMSFLGTVAASEAVSGMVGMRRGDGTKRRRAAQWRTGGDSHIVTHVRVHF